VTHRVWLAALAALALSVGGTSTAAGAASTQQQVPLPFALPAQPMSAAGLAELPMPDVVGARAIGDYDAPAVMYGVWDPARGTALRAFGLSNRETGTPASADQSFRIASITKTFTATAVLLLVDDGEVRLDAPVARYVGDLVGPLVGGRGATVRRLLNMTSGFPDYGHRDDGPFTSAALTPQRVWTPAQLVRVAARYAPEQPGAFGYSNTNYAILGELVARVSGIPFGTFVRRRILQPLGLTHTRIPSPTRTAPVAMHGYLDASWGSAGRAGTDATDWSTSAGGAAAGGVSTLEDLARWAAADFGDALLSPHMRAARLRRVPSGHLLRGSAYGLGLQIEQGWHFHVGELFGWESLAMASPRSGRVVVVVRNACCGSPFETYLTAREAMPALTPVVDPVYHR
jgi:D-alanyl-D-alanine carboxypeptidase